MYIYIYKIQNDFSWVTFWKKNYLYST